jgi:hypothetical protein
MKFEEINEEHKVFPGEYLLYTPTRQIVICGVFNRAADVIKVLSNGKLIQDKIENFHKILVKKSQGRPTQRNCGGCKGQ